MNLVGAKSSLIYGYLDRQTFLDTMRFSPKLNWIWMVLYASQIMGSIIVYLPTNNADDKLLSYPFRIARLVWGFSYSIK